MRTRACRPQRRVRRRRHTEAARSLYSPPMTMADAEATTAIPDSPTPRPRRLAPLITLLALLLVALGLRVYGLTAHSFWQDEFLALELSTGRGFEDLRFPVNGD